MKNLLNITKNAAIQLTKIAKENNSKNILFYIKGGGCNGFNYKFEPTNEKPLKLDEIIKIPNENDNDDETNIIVCNRSLIHLIGTKIDWKKTDKILSNNCGHYLVPHNKAIDIDNIDDWYKAEALYSYFDKKKKL